MICDMKLMCWICDMEIYLYMSYIFAVKIVGLKKQKKRDNMQALCRLPPTAKSSLPSAADGKEATWQPTVLPGS